MITVAAGVDAALRQQAPVIRPRVTWEQGNLSGTPVNSLDLSDRLISFPGCSSSMGAYLGGVQSMRETLTIRNDDRMFTPGYSGGHFGNRTAADRLMARIRVEIGVQLKDGSFGYVPLYSGHVDNHVCPPGTVDFDLVSPFEMLRNVTVPEDVVIEPYPHSSYGDTPASLARSLISDNSPLDTTAHFDGTWDTMETAYRELDWCIGGRIRAGTSIASATEVLARSGLATIIPGEDGVLRLISELPEQMTRRHDHYGDLIDETNAADFHVVEATNVACTAVNVAYNSVSIRYPNTAHSAEGDVGRLHRMVACPYIYLGRTAELAAYVLYTQNAVETTPLAVSWSMDLRGLLIQLGDRARVKDPVTDAEHTVRITSKAVGSGRVFLTGLTDGHESSVIQGTFAEWGSTSWGDSTEVLF